MTRALILGTALILAACSNASDETISTPVVEISDAPVAASTETMMDEQTVEVTTKAVLLYADWCSSCKALDPKIKAVKAMGSMPGLEFVTLNYTDRDADAFYTQAAHAGVEKAIRTELNGIIKTGWLLLVNVDDAQVVSKVTKDDETPQIVAKLKDALATS